MNICVIYSLKWFIFNSLFSGCNMIIDTLVINWSFRGFFCLLTFIKSALERLLNETMEGSTDPFFQRLILQAQLNCCTVSNVMLITTRWNITQQALTSWVAIEAHKLTYHKVTRKLWKRKLLDFLTHIA